MLHTRRKRQGGQQRKRRREKSRSGGRARQLPGNHACDEEGGGEELQKLVVELAVLGSRGSRRLLPLVDGLEELVQEAGHGRHSARHPNVISAARDKSFRSVSKKPKNDLLMKTVEIVSRDLPEEDAAGGGNDAREDNICCQSPFIQCRARPSSFRSGCRVHRAQRKM